MKPRAVRDDRGAAAVFIAASLFLLAGFAALSIDIGAGTDERRQDQTGADSAALGGSLELVISTQSNPMRAALAEIYVLVNDNLGRTVPPAAWDACIDPGALTYRTKTDSAFFGLIAGDNPSDCVSLSADRNILRVRVPIQNVDATFGQVLGVSSVPVSAFAEAARNTESGGASGAFPTGVLDGTPPGTELCAKTTTPGKTDPSQTCPGPSTGDFELFRPYFYGPVGGDPSSICNNTEGARPMARAIADGIDHGFSWSPVPKTDPSFTPLVNGFWCKSGIPGPPLPNQVDSAAGFQAADITNGLVIGSGKGDTWPGSQNYLGRLQRGPFVYTDSRMARLFEDKFAAGDWYEIDNRPLWDFIDDTKTMSASCMLARDETLYAAHPSTTADVYAALTALQACLADLNPINTEIFISDVGMSPRLAAAPLYWETNPIGANSCVWGSPTKCYTIKSFVPIWIEGLFVPEGPGFTCTGTLELMVIGTQQICIHHPGMVGETDINPPGGENVDSATALLLKCSHLPADVCAALEAGGGPRDLTGMYDLQLTR